MELSLFKRILLLYFAAPVAHAECTSCDDGIEIRDADPLGDGFYRCNNVDNYYLFSLDKDSAECKEAQFEVMTNCCPSQVNGIAKNNACGWCPNGVTDLGASVNLPFQTVPVTCGEVMILVSGGAVETGICGLAGSVASICCPGDEGGAGFYCEFCPDGVEFPAKINPEAENLSCSQVQAAALLANETSCDSWIKPLEDNCCPNTNSNSGCEFCDAGLDNPTLKLPVTGITCEQFKASAALAPDGTQCNKAFKPAESLCCPSTTDFVSCDFCLAGLENPTFIIPSFGGATCQDFQDSSLSVSVESDCSAIKAVEKFCCPNTTEVVACNFCPGGLETPPNETIPLLAGLTCDEFQTAARFIINSTECDTSIKPLEGLCCPSTTESFQCDWCSGEAGVEYPEQEFAGLGLSCGTISSLVPAVTYEELCDQYKAAESLCCPSSPDVSPRPEYCYLCGNAKVEMKRPDYQPFVFGVSDGLDDQRTCAQLEESLNADRLPGESCTDTLSSFTLLFSPSICGCEGLTPPNPCELCGGRGVKRDAKVPGENFTCGEGFDFIQHVSPVFCSNPGIDLLGIESVCCTDILDAGGGESQTASTASVRTEVFVALACLFMCVVVV